MSRDPNIRLAENIFGLVMRPLNRLCFWIEQVNSQLEQRKTLVEFIFSLKQNIDDISRIRKLERRIEKFENMGWVSEGVSRRIGDCDSYIQSNMGGIFAANEQDMEMIATDSFTSYK
jgi:hypothetical protein